MRDYIDVKNGGMYFLVFLGVNFIFQKLFRVIFENILKLFLAVNPGYSVNILFENLISFIIYLILVSAAIFFSIYSLREYLRSENREGVVITATAFYVVYLVVFQIIMVSGELFKDQSIGAMQVIFIVVNILLFYLLSRKYLRVKIG